MYATTEAIDTAAAKRRLVTTTGSDTVRTTVFDLIRGPEWPTGYSGRAIVNETTTHWHGREGDLRISLDSARADYRRAVADDDVSRRVIWAGAALDRLHEIRPAADVVRAITHEAAQATAGDQ